MSCPTFSSRVICLRSDSTRASTAGSSRSRPGSWAERRAPPNTDQERNANQEKRVTRPARPTGLRRGTNLWCDISLFLGGVLPLGVTPTRHLNAGHELFVAKIWSAG